MTPMAGPGVAVFNVHHQVTDKFRFGGAMSKKKEPKNEVAASSRFDKLSDDYKKETIKVQDVPLSKIDEVPRVQEVSTKNVVVAKEEAVNTESKIESVVNDEAQKQIGIDRKNAEELKIEQERKVAEEHADEQVDEVKTQQSVDNKEDLANASTITIEPTDVAQLSETTEHKSNQSADKFHKVDVALDDSLDFEKHGGEETQKKPKESKIIEDTQEHPSKAGKKKKGDRKKEDKH